MTQTSYMLFLVIDEMEQRNDFFFLEIIALGNSRLSKLCFEALFLRKKKCVCWSFWVEEFRLTKDWVAKLYQRKKYIMLQSPPPSVNKNCLVSYLCSSLHCNATIKFAYFQINHTIKMRTSPTYRIYFAHFLVNNTST